MCRRRLHTGLHQRAIPLKRKLRKFALWKSVPNELFVRRFVRIKIRKPNVFLGRFLSWQRYCCQLKHPAVIYVHIYYPRTLTEDALGLCVKYVERKYFNGNILTMPQVIIISLPYSVWDGPAWRSECAHATAAIKSSTFYIYMYMYIVDNPQ